MSEFNLAPGGVLTSDRVHNRVDSPSGRAPISNNSRKSDGVVVAQTGEPFSACVFAEAYKIVGLFLALAISYGEKSYSRGSGEAEMRKAGEPL